MEHDFPFAVYPSLDGRVVFITGGGSGIGESLVRHFCAQGANVTFVDHVLQADEGCDFDFLLGKREAGIPRHSH